MPSSRNSAKASVSFVVLWRLLKNLAKGIVVVTVSKGIPVELLLQVLDRLDKLIISRLIEDLPGPRFLASR